MRVVILAGGYGTRLSEETDNLPKPLVEIGGKPILWHIMKTYAAHGLTDFVICLGYQGTSIKRYFSNFVLNASDVTFDFTSGEMTLHQTSVEPWRVTLVDTGRDTQTGGRLKRVREYLGDETFCFTYGDGVSDVNITAAIDFHKAHGKAATVTAVPPPGRFGRLSLNGDQVERFAEKQDNENAFINGGYFVLEPSVLDRIAGDDMPWEHEPLHTLAEDEQLMAYKHTGFWAPMDTLRDKRMLEDLWAENQAPWKVWQD